MAMNPDRRGRVERARLETTLARSGAFQPRRGEVDSKFDGPDLLGGFTSITPRLTTRDLLILAYLCERFTWLHQSGDEGAADAGIASTTFYELGHRIFDCKPGGRQNAMLKESLKRLWDAEIEFRGYDPMRNKKIENFGFSGRLLMAYGVSDLDTLTSQKLWSEVGSKRNATINLYLAPWLVKNILAGRVTYLNFSTMKRLEALACRLWVYLEAETYKQVGGKVEQTAIGLGGPALATLGVDGYAEHRDARKALIRAGANICKEDTKYKSIKTVRNPYSGWTLLVERWSKEARARAAEVREATQQFSAEDG